MSSLLFLVFVVVVGLLVFALWRIVDAANAADPAHRTMEPGMIWLLLIPIFQVYWNFRSLPAVSESLTATLRDKGLKTNDCGRAIGRVWALLVLAIYVLHVIAWTAEGLFMSIGADGLVSLEMTLVGLVVMLAWLAVFGCIIAYVVQVQAAKAQIVSSEKPTASQG